MSRYYGGDGAPLFRATDGTLWRWNFFRGELRRDLDAEDAEDAVTRRATAPEGATTVSPAPGGALPPKSEEA